MAKLFFPTITKLWCPFKNVCSPSQNSSHYHTIMCRKKVVKFLVENLKVVTFLNNEFMTESWICPGRKNLLTVHSQAVTRTEMGICKYGFRIKLNQARDLTDINRSLHFLYPRKTDFSGILKWLTVLSSILKWSRYASPREQCDQVFPNIKPFLRNIAR